MEIWSRLNIANVQSWDFWFRMPSPRINYSRAGCLLILYTRLFPNHVCTVVSLNLAWNGSAWNWRTRENPISSGTKNYKVTHFSTAWLQSRCDRTRLGTISISKSLTRFGTVSCSTIHHTTRFGTFPEVRDTHNKQHRFQRRRALVTFVSFWFLSVAVRGI